MRPDLTRNLLRNACTKPAAGFTYLGLLILLAIMGIVSAAAVQMGVAVHRRTAEEALLDVGREFSRALESYRRATPSGVVNEPMTLKDLLKDPRLPGTVRHLRKLFNDPITGQQEWGLLRSEDTQRIVGVFSLSEARPIKIANFDLRLRRFEGKLSYQAWVFTAMQSGMAGGSDSVALLIDPRELVDDPEYEDAASNSEPDEESDSAPDSQFSVFGYIRALDL